MLVRAGVRRLPLPSGRVRRKLQHAPELLEEVQPGCFLIQHAGLDGRAKKGFVIDAEHDAQNQIERWLQHCANAPGVMIKLEPAHKPLVISGGIKVGSASATHLRALSLPSTLHSTTTSSKAEVQTLVCVLTGLA